MAAELVKLPGLGEVPRNYLMIGGAVVIGVVGYAWWRQGGSIGQEPAPAPNPDLIPVTDRTPVVGDSTGDFDETNPDVISTNAQWTQRSVEFLSATGSWDPGLITTALGKYLNRKPLTAIEQDVVLSARGAFGDPPQNGPFAIVPALPDTAQKPTVAPGNVRVTSKSVITGGDRASVGLAWDPVPGATGYKLRAYDVTRGQQAGDQDSADAVHLYQPMWRKTSYRFEVAAVNTAGTGPYASVTTTTP